MRKVLALIPLVLAMFACDDNAGGSGAPLGPARDMGIDVGIPVVGFPKKLIIEGESDLSRYYNTEVPLRVQYVDDGNQDGPAGDTPEVGGSVQFTIEQAEGQQAVATLNPMTQTTDNNGFAQVTLTTGGFPARFRVIAEAANARPVAWTIRISKNPLGDLAVTVKYGEGRYQVSRQAPMTESQFETVEVKLVQIEEPADGMEGTADETCESITVINGRASFTAPAIRNFDGQEVVNFAAVPDDISFAVIAVAKGFSGRTLARACKGPVTVGRGGSGTTQVELNLVDEPLEFKGVYEIEHELSLESMLRGTDDENLDGFLDVLSILGALGGGYGMGTDMTQYPRGTGTIRVICDLIDEPTVSNFCPIIELVGAETVQRAIEDNISADGLAALDAIGDLYRNFNEFKIYGTKEFRANYPNDEGYLRRNTSSWEGVRFVWRDNCQGNTQLDCERDFPFTTSDNATPITAEFDALYEADTDTLYITRHEMNLNYGTLVLLALENWILPAVIPEADVDMNDVVSLSELLGVVINCQNITSNPAGQDVCDLVIDAGGRWLRGQILNIDDSTELFTIEGSVQIADEVTSLTVCDQNDDMMARRTCPQGQICATELIAEIDSNAIDEGYCMLEELIECEVVPGMSPNSGTSDCADGLEQTCRLELNTEPGKGFCNPFVRTPTEPDLKVDRLINGVWNGTFGSDSMETELTPNIGLFHGCRSEDCIQIDALYPTP